MCRYEKCRQKPLMPSQHQLRHDGSVVRNSHFFETLKTFSWCREWVKVVLRCLRQKEAITPPDQPIHSLQALEYLEMLELKIARGLKNLQFEETYNEWSRLLRESGLVHPLWNLSEILYSLNPRRWSSSKKSCRSRDRACGSPTSYWDSVILT